MAFQESADSLRAKLHITNVSTPLLVGVCCIVVLALGMAAFLLWSTLSADTFSVTAESAEAPEPPSSGSEEEPAAAPTIMVHVGGAVVAPGLYELPERSRVNDAIVAAGGMDERAASDALNLARAVADGEQIIVPTIEEQQAQAAADPASPTAMGKVNINTADAELLDTLPGVGESTAEKIIADRERNGPFSSPEDLKRVSGIGDKKFEELADLITVG